MGTAAVIAHNLGAQRQGHNWRCSCPLGCGYDLSLADGENGLLAFCFGGHRFDEIVPALVEYGLLDGDVEMDPAYAGNGSVPHHRDDAARIAGAVEIYNLGSADERIGIYLHSRAIMVSSPVLRFSAQVPHRLGVRLPGLLAPIVDVNDAVTGVHMTYLRHDGSGKADLGNPEFQRECRGVIKGGAIRLAIRDPRRELIIAEGIETALSASEIFQLPAWSAVYAGGLKSTVLPLTVRRIIIAVDHDANGCSQRNALQAHERWATEGREVRIVMPPIVGDDFNDVLRGQR